MMAINIHLMDVINVFINVNQNVWNVLMEFAFFVLMDLKLLMVNVWMLDKFL